MLRAGTGPRWRLSRTVIVACMWPTASAAPTPSSTTMISFGASVCASTLAIACLRKWCRPRVGMTTEMLLMLPLR